MRRRAAISLIACMMLAPVTALAIDVYEKDDFKIKLRGHYQMLTTSYDDPYYDMQVVMTPGGPVLVPASGHVTSNACRFRTTWRVLTGTEWSFETSVDMTYTFGSVLDSLIFKTGKEMPPPTFYNLRDVWIDEEGRYGTAEVYRALLTYEADKYRVIIGRQRLAYGTALFWSPIDIWNPASPLAVEPEEKVGVDGVSGIWWIDDDTSATALWGVGDTWDGTRIAASLAHSIESYTFDFLIGKLNKDMVYGMDFVGYLGDAGVRGEMTYTVADQKDDYFRGVIGIDYGFENSLYLALEYYYNGGPMKIDPAAPLDAYFEATGVDSLNRNFVGLMASYDVDPLVKAQAAVILDIDKGSEAFAPSLLWYATNEIVVSAGGQFFEGSKYGEYGEQEDMGWVKVRYDY